MRWLARTQSADGDDALGAVVAGNLLAFGTGLAFALPVDGALASDWLAIAWLGVFQVAVAYVLVTRGLALVPALQASLLLLVEPVLNPLWVWIVLGESPGLVALAGGGIIVLATALHTVAVARTGVR